VNTVGKGKTLFAMDVNSVDECSEVFLRFSIIEFETVYDKPDILK
jgi:hypothetical protein